jgi:TRAP transporter TAXI family solute receptor
MHLAASVYSCGWKPAGRTSAGLCSRRIGLGAVLALLAAASASAQAPQPPAPAPAPLQPPPQPPAAVSPYQALRAKLNQDTLIVAAGRPGTAYLGIADDLTSAVGESVRVLPVAGDGGLANLKDVLFLRGVDLAIVPANVLDHAKTANALGAGLPQRLAYVTVLYSEEVHLVVGPGVATVEDLRGKRVAVPANDGSAQFTAADIFRRLGIAVDSVPREPADALDEVRAGAVAAAVLVGGKPLAPVSALPKDGSLRLLPLPAPAGEGYVPAVLRSEDYPAMIPPQAMVETVAVAAVLVAPKGVDETARRVAKHAPALLEAIARLAVAERHPKWRDVNLGAVLPGWSRLEAAETWLARAFARHRDRLKGQFDDFLRADNRVKSSELSMPQRKKLFEDFEVWSRKSVTSQPPAK